MSALASVAAVTMTTHCAGRGVLKQRKFILSQTRRPEGPEAHSQPLAGSCPLGGSGAESLPLPASAGGTVRPSCLKRP